MIVLIDENIAQPIADGLRDAGWDVASVAILQRGAPDPQVLEMAVHRAAVLVTDDKDFGELVVRRRMSHRGVLLLQLAGVSLAERVRMVVSLFAQLGDELAMAFIVLDRHGRIRVRPLDPI